MTVDPESSTADAGAPSPAGRARGGLALARRALVALRLHALARRLLRLIEGLDPSLLLARWQTRSDPAPRVVLVCVYRRRNAARVAEILASSNAITPLLWALDDTAPELAFATVGEGPGDRFALLQACLDAGRLPDDAWIVVADDDVRLRRGSVVDLARTAAAAGLGLSQPAHSWTSYWNWPYTRRRLGVLARSGGFVEIGPVLAVAPSARPLVLPFPSGEGMGWGVEAMWHQRQTDGLRLGVVDAVLIDHLSPAATEYDDTAARARQLDRQQEHGVADLAAIQVDTRTWHAWQRLPGSGGGGAAARRPDARARD